MIASKMRCIVPQNETDMIELVLQVEGIDMQSFECLMNRLCKGSLKPSGESEGLL